MAALCTQACCVSRNQAYWVSLDASSIGRARACSLLEYAGADCFVMLLQGQLQMQWQQPNSSAPTTHSEPTQQGTHPQTLPPILQAGSRRQGCMLQLRPPVGAA